MESEKTRLRSDAEPQAWFDEGVKVLAGFLIVAGVGFFFLVAKPLMADSPRVAGAWWFFPASFLGFIASFLVAGLVVGGTGELVMNSRWAERRRAAHNANVDRRTEEARAELRIVSTTLIEKTGLNKIEK